MVEFLGATNSTLLYYGSEIAVHEPIAHPLINCQNNVQDTECYNSTNCITITTQFQTQVYKWNHEGKFYWGNYYENQL